MALATVPKYRELKNIISESWVLIKLKRNLNQAKIQVIHKLTRKAKTMSQKKVPQQLQEKLKRKSESAVNEVLIIKKMKMKDLARFMLTHKGHLNIYLNKPKVDNEKACARLLLHKALNDKYKFIREKFASVPINDLLMSREESRKLKKEVKEKKKNKKKGATDVPERNKSNELDITGFQIESDPSDIDSDNKEDDLMSGQSSDIEDYEGNKILRVTENKEDKPGGDADNSHSDSEISHVESGEQNEVENSLSDKETEIRQDSLSTVEKQTLPNMAIKKKSLSASLVGKPVSQLHSVKRKAKDRNKNKNLNEKLLSRNFKKIDNVAAPENKVVDPFFITDTGENYLSIAEVRQPDEIKEVHKQGNRRLRRAVMFGHAPKYQPKRDNFKYNNYNNNDDKFGENRAELSSRNDNRSKIQSQTKQSWKKFDDVKVEPKEEKLHPSWEAKKKQSSNLPFQGKKIVFDDS